MIRVIFKPGLLRLAENNLAGITIDLEIVERIGKLINKFAIANPQLIMPVHIVLWKDKVQFLNDRNFDGQIDKDTSKLAKVSKECEWYMEALFQRGEGILAITSVLENVPETAIGEAVIAAAQEVKFFADRKKEQAAVTKEVTKQAKEVNEQADAVKTKKDAAQQAKEDTAEETAEKQEKAAKAGAKKLKEKLGELVGLCRPQAVAIFEVVRRLGRELGRIWFRVCVVTMFLNRSPDVCQPTDFPLLLDPLSFCPWWRGIG